MQLIYSFYAGSETYSFWSVCEPMGLLLMASICAVMNSSAPRYHRKKEERKVHRYIQTQESRRHNTGLGYAVIGFMQ